MQPHLADSTLTIDLSAIAHNYHTLSALAPRSICAAVIKADAYGLGVVPIARRLYAIGCRHFFVAHVAEAIKLRSTLGPEVTIYVLHGVRRGQETLFVEANLIPVLNHIEQIENYAAYSKHLSSHLPAILHIDTGMNRLGITLQEAHYLREKRQSPLHHLNLHFIMSHLSCSGEKDNPENALQLARLHDAMDIFPHTPVSFCNSGGILLGSDYHFSMVRPGIALFGGYNTRPCDISLKHVITLSCKPLQIRTVDDIHTVGYGATATVEKGTRIATLPIGYADGYLRILGHKSHVFYGDIALPVIGRISMDMITVDVSNVTHALNSQSIFTVIGEHYTIDDIANDASTIGYEILTRLGNRYHRHYIG